MESVISWNENNLSNPIFIKYYFGEKTQEDFFNNLLPKITKLHNKLLSIRDNNTNIEGTEIIIEDAKHESFIFTEKLLEE